MRLAAAVIVALAVALSAAVAQPRPGSPAVPAPPQPPAPEAPPTAYEPDLLRMAEIVGSLAFLRQLCGGAEAAQWRKRMADLLEAEGTTQGRRERLAGAYNRGFRGYALTYRSCTSAAIEATTRLTQDGERLSRALAGRFGG
jgi:uncharacterized protein (TIGR02301 family)